ncbi:aminotransferase-like domain-containing protein [Mesoterricola sediminis]|uniref:GntR family transcriptional regulator n=1 Tax=Mesoterricola sediminis TaxID=2927980 RepID=A0AA48GWJ4_9BACT|nr:PLP-dependent aminotransferase family protein [Mesoterricola sediminis]BDU75392.1 GntR family transcriptional regulator [Mesoterricola sediminis]
MRARELNLTLDPDRAGPIYVRAAEAILQAVRSGRIQRGQALPGIRELAERLGVHRNTALAALRELEAQGWLEARPRSGFFVVEALPERPLCAGAGPGAAGPGFDVPGRLRPITSTSNVVLDFSDGVADARLAPTEALARAYPRALRLKGPELLQAGAFMGHARLRRALAAHVAEQRALVREPDQVLVIRSTSMAVSLVAQALVGPAGGDVAVETPGHPLVWETLRQASAARIHGLPVDAGGLQVEALEALLARTPLHLLVLTPQCHMPTGVALAADRRERILALARAHRFAILELDGEYDYLEAPPVPLAAQDTTGQVLYFGSLSRLLAPGIRLGFLVVPGNLAEGLAKARQRMDWQGDPVLEWAVSELFLDGEIARHLRRVRKACQDRRAALLDALRFHLPGLLAFEGTPGGMALWLRGAGKMADPARFDIWIRSCGLKGIKLRLGSYFDLEGRPLAATRLGFTAYTPAEIQDAVPLMT